MQQAPPASALVEPRLDHHPRPSYYARQILNALKASDRPTADPPTPFYVAPFPTAWLYAWCPSLPPAAQILLPHLVALSMRFTGCVANRWWWRPDRDLGDHAESGLIMQTGLSRRTLARARNTLRDYGLLFLTDHSHTGTATCYSLRWPPPLPPPADPDDIPASRATDRRRAIVAAEIQRSGEPWPPSAAWHRLCTFVAGDDGGAAANALLLATDLDQATAALDILQAIPTGPWLRRQLAWAIPDACPSR